MPVNSQLTVALGGRPTRIAVGDPKIVDVKILKDSRGGAELLLVGLKPGLSSMKVWMAGRDQRVMQWNVHVLTAMSGALNSRGLGAGAQVDAAGDNAALVSGQSSSAILHEGAAKTADQTAGGKADNVVDLSTVGTPGTVQVDVKIVEVSKSVLKQVGIDISGSHGPFSSGFSYAPSGLGAVGSTTSGFNFLYSTSQVSASLQLLETDALARVLAEPSLVALSGQSASFLAGGEIPVPESGGLGTQNVTYKPYGIGLTVTPTVLAPNRIALKVAPEASELDTTNGVTITDGTTSTFIPGLVTRRADTTVELGDGQSFIISGLVSRETKAEVDKIPLLGDLPIIGAFFRSINYSQDDKELIIIVTPHLVRPIAAGTNIPLPGAAQEANDSGFNAWGYYLLGPYFKQKMPGFSR